MSRLREQYRTKVLPDLKKDLGFDNDFQVPRFLKIVVNAGIGKLLQENPKILDSVIDDISLITGQSPVKTKARKSIASFKLREKQVIGVAVTLRGKRMYEFLDKLINATFPRIRDFRGYGRKGFDGHGNYTVGFKEHIVFPEMANRENVQNFGVEVVMVTTAKDDESGYKLLKKFGFPFKD